MKFGAPIWVVIVLIACSSAWMRGQTQPSRTAWRNLDPPVIDGKWARPPASGSARPIWGHAGGLRVGLSPVPGPRGLLRIYAPYLDHHDGRVINYIAVEPIVEGQVDRGLSELEHSKLDRTRGKRFWSVDDPLDPSARLATAAPARGEIGKVEGVESLRVNVAIEPFDNGAHVYLRLTFRADRPHEVAIATFARDDSLPLDRCVITATMGNYARLRTLHLADRTASAKALWPDYRGEGFSPHAKFDLDQLVRTKDCGVMVSATPDEQRPEDADYAAGTRPHWRYSGKRAAQFWRSEAPHPSLQAWVNGRGVYWASRSPIPGGISFENFEMVAPFQQGQEFWFGVEPMPAPDHAKATTR